ncbi:hypothetical protein ACFT54_09805 [Streptomyces cinereoruber]|uniref:hypothetical protein n=1 Tax=Streptomyces cinereoruber TaxID=67260 RepID=UPI00362C974D
MNPIDTEAEAETKTGEELPPYSGEDTLCPMCSETEPYTRYRPKITGYKVIEYNGRNRHSPLPECLERQCRRCDYRWDEALNPPPPADTAARWEGFPPIAIVEDVAHALDFALRRCTVALSSDTVRLVAGELKELLYMERRPDHPAWGPDARGKSLLITPPPPDGPTEGSSDRPIPLTRRNAPDLGQAPGGDR